MFIRKTIAVVAFLGALAATPASASLVDDVRNALQAFHTAVSQGDTDTLLTMTSDDFHAVYGGAHHDKAGFIAAVASDFAKQDIPPPAFAVHDLVVTQPAANVAVATYATRVTAPDGTSTEHRHMTVLQQDDQNNWVVHAHAGPNFMTGEGLTGGIISP
jgi:ketosteroid isomerase-like protein